MREAEANLKAEISTNWHVGVDEAGRGCLAGPVVAAAVLAPPDFDFFHAFPGLTDSKALNATKRETLRRAILNSLLLWGVGFSWPREIDQVNILNATFRAMSRAVCALFLSIERKKTIYPGAIPFYPLYPIVIDGPHPIRLSEWQASQRKNTSFVLPRQYTLVHGDAILPSISAASILAKTQRDKLMLSLDKRYQGYALAQHKGYGTKVHVEALTRLGVSTIHRKSFAPCAMQNSKAEQGFLL